MYLLNEQNRTSNLKAVDKRMKYVPRPIALNKMAEGVALTEPDYQIPSKTVLFLEVLRPMSGSQGETLKFLKQTTDQAGFEVQYLFACDPARKWQEPLLLKRVYGSYDRLLLPAELFQKRVYPRRNFSSLPLVFREHDREIKNLYIRIQARQQLYQTLGKT